MAEGSLVFSVRLFATLKDRAGKARVSVTVPAEATVGELLNQLGKETPALAPALASTIVAVNHDFAGADTILNEGDEIALFPPVSGGSRWPTYFAVTTEALDFDGIRRRLTTADVGAFISFTGSVRGETSRDGLPPATLHLEYEAYEEMATIKMAQIAGEIWQRWPDVKGIAIVQRIGKLDIGEVTTFVACAAGHRDQGVFEAARFGIDRLKEIVPVWKKEVGVDQSVWLEGDYRPSPGDRHS